MCLISAWLAWKLHKACDDVVGPDLEASRRRCEDAARLGTEPEETATFAEQLSQYSAILIELESVLRDLASDVLMWFNQDISSPAGMELEAE